MTKTKTETKNTISMNEFLKEEFKKNLIRRKNKRNNNCLEEKKSEKQNSH